jgi:hypothetical protein
MDVPMRRLRVCCRSYYDAAFSEGRLRVEGSLDSKGGLRPGQCCRHFVHRHEPPVPAGVSTGAGAADADCSAPGGGCLRRCVATGAAHRRQPTTGTEMHVH